jgi:hypothetical protein
MDASIPTTNAAASTEAACCRAIFDLAVELLQIADAQLLWYVLLL